MTGRLRVDPQLPAQWSEASLQNVPFGATRLNLEMHRVDAFLEVEAVSQKPIKLCLQSSREFFAEAPCDATEATSHRLRISLPKVEVGLEQQSVQPGASTDQIKFIHQEYGAHSLNLRLDVPSGRDSRIYLRTNGTVRSLKVTGARRDGDWLIVAGNATGGYSERTIEVLW
jgi:hypothetical protein